MAISFLCTHCGQVNQASDDDAGLPWACDQCRGANYVPHPIYRPFEPATPRTCEGDSPFRPLAPASAGRGIPPQVAASPAIGPPPMAVDRARRRLLGPAIGMLASALFCLLTAPVFTINNLAHRAAIGDLSPDASERLGQTFVLYSICGLMVLLAGLVLGGSIAMITVRNYPLAWIGLMAALVPCNPCFVIGIPFSIWGMTVLANGDIKNCFYRPPGT